MLKPDVIAKKQFLIVEDILEFKRKHEELLMKVFLEKEDMDKFKMGLKEAFETFLNKDPNQIAEFLAKFLDYHLKKVTSQVGGLSGDNVMEKLIDDVI